VAEDTRPMPHVTNYIIKNKAIKQKHIKYKYNEKNKFNFSN